jgi:SOS-response transcriptional repressor LexA
MIWLTEKQREVLLLIVSRLRQDEHPTLRSMGDELGTKQVGVMYHVAALVKKGYLERRGWRGRSGDAYSLTEKGKLETYGSEAEMEAIGVQYMRRWLPEFAEVEIKVSYRKGSDVGTGANRECDGEASDGQGSSGRD